MTAKTIPQNIPVLPSGFDSGNTNSQAPTPAQMQSGFLSNVDKVAAETQNYLHQVSTTFVYLAQLLGILLPFNPDPISGKSLVATPKGGVVSLVNAATGATEFYVARNAMVSGYSDPSGDPTNWALINFNAIATYSNPYSDATGTSDAIIGTYPSVIYPVLQDGFVVTIGIQSPNLTTTPTFQPVLNGSTQTALIIKKKTQSGNYMPLAVGELVGSCTLEFDGPANAWILKNPPSHGVQPGTIIIYSGATVPPGYLQIPQTLTLISRAAYPALFEAIGTTYSAGDGLTTFGMPFITPGYAAIHYLGVGALGTSKLGQVINHVHQYNTYITAGQTAAAGGYNLYNLPQTPNTGNPTTGGTANLAAGMLFNFAIKY